MSLDLEFVEEPQLPLMLRHYAGPEYKTMDDHKRLDGQHERIKRLMADSKWRTLQEIERETGYSTASISAQLRHLRKIGFGGHQVNRRPSGNRENGLFEYQVVLNWKADNIFGKRPA